LVPSRACYASSTHRSFRIGFSNSHLTEVNGKDAMAAMKIWAKTIAEERGVPIEPEITTFETLDSLNDGLRERRVDAAAINTREYAFLRHGVRFDPIFFHFESGTPTTRYVLLANRNGAVHAPADLKGKRLRIHQAPRTCLAPLWLDILLAKDGFFGMDGFLAEVRWERKLPNVLLPLFFQKTEACLVTRDGFDTMRELNPQVGERLMVIAESPEVVTRLFAFRADFQSHFRKEILSSLESMHQSVEGRQILNLFRTDELRRKPETFLETSLKIVEEHGRLLEKVAPR
jgi:phosphonate transport system substrate-binding protein